MLDIAPKPSPAAAGPCRQQVYSFGNQGLKGGGGGTAGCSRNKAQECQTGCAPAWLDSTSSTIEAEKAKAGHDRLMALGRYILILPEKLTAGWPECKVLLVACVCMPLKCLKECSERDTFVVLMTLQEAKPGTSSSLLQLGGPHTSSQANTAHLLSTLLVFARAIPMAARAAMAIGVDAAWQSWLAGESGCDTSESHGPCTPHTQPHMECSLCQQVILVV